MRGMSVENKEKRKKHKSKVIVHENFNSVRQYLYLKKIDKDVIQNAILFSFKILNLEIDLYIK